MKLNQTIERGRASRPCVLGRVAAVVMAGLLGWVASARVCGAEDDKRSRDPGDAEECRLQLRKVHEALEAFRAERGQWPGWLSELVPQYLDRRLLDCPFVKRRGNPQEWRAMLRGDVFQDPEKATTYGYEFCAKELFLWTGVRKTWAEYKREVMKLVGDEVPIVRCFAHDPVLNLTVGGRIYTSGKDWEDRFPQIPHERFHPEAVFRHLPPRVDPARLARRDGSLDSRALDLSARYNAYLDESWLPYLQHAFLQRLKPGRVELRGIAFDVRGVVQLAARGMLAPYPAQAAAVVVGRAGSRLHFLHACHHSPGEAIEPGTPVALHRVRFEGGEEVAVSMEYGRDLGNWIYDLRGSDGGGAAVWLDGNPEATRLHQGFRLFLSSWPVPGGSRRIEALVLGSAGGEAAPFVVAVSVE